MRILIHVGESALRREYLKRANGNDKATIYAQPTSTTLVDVLPVVSFSESHHFSNTFGIRLCQHLFVVGRRKRTRLKNFSNTLASLGPFNMAKNVI